MIRLLVNAYTDPDAARNAELQEAARRNRANRAIGAIHSIDGRPTFGELFRQANAASHPDDVLIFANTDIYFDATISKLEIGVNESYALTRWERSVRDLRLFEDDDGPRRDSQDAWIFRSPIRQSLIDAATFSPGVRGCDNRLAYEMHKAGYKMANPSKSIRAIHLHRSEIRRYGHEPGDCIPGPYLLIGPHELGQMPQTRLCL